MAQEDSVTEIPAFLPRAFYMVLLAFGIGFYFIWSAMFDAWTDIAVYAVSVVCIGLGLVGTILYRIVETE
jgi:hypothetical protein